MNDHTRHTAAADPGTEISAAGVSYRMVLPNAATDYIQRTLLAGHRPYEPEMLEDMRSRIAPGSLVLDVGANVGNHSLYLAAVARCRVEAFEPNPVLCDAIRASAALNGLQDAVHVHAVGVGRATARASFEKDVPENLGAQRLRVGEGEFPVVALDSIQFDSTVAAIKIDVEGMEADVLQGAQALIERSRPILYVECAGDAEFRAVSRWLDDRGYTFWDTFNATPTHLFLPIESVSLDRRLARLQLRAVHDDYRSTLIATSVRQKLTRAYENERTSRQQIAELERELARLTSERAEALANAEATTLTVEKHLLRIAALEAEASTQRDLARCAEEQRERLTGELRAGRAEHERLQARTEELQAHVAQLQARSEHLQARTEELQAGTEQLQTTTEQLRARHTALERETAELQRDLAEAHRAIRVKTSRLAVTDRRLERVSSSTSYRLGSALVGATRSVRAALQLPGQLWLIARNSRARQVALPPLPEPASPSASSAAPHPTAKAPQPVARPPALPARAQLGVRKHRDFASLSELRIACVLDEFSYHSFAPECQLLQLRADRWQQQIEAFDPDFVLIESAWRGADDTWMKKVSDPSTELLALIDWALARRVGTAFWCKEDPVHFARFLPVARLVDHVFTTDIDCIPRYKDALRHERVHLLLFAAQPAMHNPVETVARRDIFSFAGSWYPHYPDRQIDFRNLVRVGRKLKSVEIFDRNANRPAPHDFVFPEEFQQDIRGHLPYTEIDRAYKGCRYGITVNTIKQSQTMFARRALELMACNTVVVSNFSKGLRLLFGDHVIASDSAVELEHRLAPLCADEARYRRHRLSALRKVLAEHTCEHRLAYLASKLFERPFEAHMPRIAMLGEPSGAEETQRLVAALERQVWPGAVLLLIGVPAPTGHPRVESLPDRHAAMARLAEFDYAAPLVASDYHGADYLTDLVLATRFARGDGVTKAAFHELDAGGHVQLRGDGQQYQPTTQAALRRSLLRPAVLEAWSRDAALRLADAWVSSASLVAVDEFGYCAQGAADAAVPQVVDVAAPYRPGLALHDQLQTHAESIGVPEVALDAEAPLVFGTADWYRLLPKQIDARLKLAIRTDECVELQSTLPAADNQYLYLTRRFAPAELKAGRETFFQLEADTRLDLRTVFVFNDASDKKISHAMHTVGAKHALTVPPGTASVRLALRVQGPGKATIGRLSLAEPRGLPSQALASAQHLVVANQYPSYDDLYRYGFVHARVRAYARSGVVAEVLRVSNDPRFVYREFEDIDITEADVIHLEQCLSGGRYASVLIHIVDQRMWGVVRKYLDRVRVVIWAHGAEIQPWWRRAMNQPTDVLRDQARRTSDARMAMWREILGAHHPNLRVVFISHKQAAEALADLQLPAEAVDGVEVISNFIDGELFRYVPKDASQRHRVLSIRPFASPVYANDLTVQAVLRLAHEPFFDQLQFRIIGDGVLFEETVAPLRGLRNVEITRAFLTQREIAALHRDYGVFLVPSRMDSQGVSRDEAMASGLVPVTTRVAAIPEFVDTACAFLAEPEDSAGLAAAVRRLHEEPALFERMSAAAAQRVRAQSGHAQTVDREMALFSREGGEARGAALSRLVEAEAAATRIALYGDLNLNVVDGSAIWAASLAEVLGGCQDIRVSLVLKARIHRTQVISRLLDMVPEVQLVEPAIPDRGALSAADAADWLVELNARRPFRAFVLRGLDVCSEAAQRHALQGRLWAYLTDIPQRPEDIDTSTRHRIDAIVAHSEFVLCQTPQMREFFVAQFPAASDKVRLLPPMIPPVGEHEMAPRTPTPFRYCYAGKFAPRWGIRELFAAHAALRSDVPGAELHVFGDKIHSPPDDPEFNPAVKARLAAGGGLLWHGAVDRDELLRRLPAMHVCWAYRDPAFERETLELSTKALEYASLGVPIILARSSVIEAVFGADYPLFATSADEATALLKRLAHDPVLRSVAAARLEQVAAQYTFAAARDRLRAGGLIPPPPPPVAITLSPGRPTSALSARVS
jgi:FkbM family methyltransferase